MTTDPTSSASPPDADGPRPVVVGIGASAGGLEALQELCRRLSPGSGVSFVIAQHLAPDRPSAIVDLLARVCDIPVREAVADQTLVTDTIYVIPPGHDAVVTGERLELVEPLTGPGPSPDIDRLFSSLASAGGSRCGGIVLSGTGSDGAAGAAAIKAADGLVVVQQPGTARFDSMPRATIAATSVDAVLPAEAIGDVLMMLGAVPAGAGADASLSSATGSASGLGLVLAALQARTGMDFSGYRTTTVGRQVGRRMAVRGDSTYAQYTATLHDDPEEAILLVRALLVSVTSFFRNPEAWAALRAPLADLVKDLPDGEALRVWVPGCSSGEEVYSLAMMISELLGAPDDLPRRLRIFGTDQDEDGLRIARRGSYPLSARSTIPDQLADRYTEVDGDRFTVAPELRDCVIFARHNLLEDPPFPRLDLVSCRNVLIYFEPPLQRAVMGRLTFPLAEGGLLWLGASESIDQDVPGIETLDPVHRIYRRSTAGSARPYRPPAPLMPRSIAAEVEVLGDVAEPTPPLDDRLAVLAAVGSVSVTGLVLDENDDLVEVLGDVGPYCRLGPGRPSAAALDHLRDELEGDGRALVLALRSAGGPSGRDTLRSKPIPLADGAVRLEARHLSVGDRSLALLSFVPDSPLDAPHVVDRDPVLSREVRRLQRELLSTRESLSVSLAELEAANEELQASSEELQAASEELQSSFEELETSHEELETKNVELGRLNAELGRHRDELMAVNDHLRSIEDSVNQGMVLVDTQLAIIRFTPLAVKVFGVTPQDVGQSLLEVPTTLGLAGFEEALRAVLAGEGRHSIEAAGRSPATGREVSYLIQLLPHRDQGGELRGAVVTITDITDTVRLRRLAQDALRDLEEITAALPEAVWKRTGDGLRVDYISARVTDLIGHTAAAVEADPALLDLIVVPEDRDAVVTARRAPSRAWDIEFRVPGPDDDVRWLRETGVPMGDAVVGTLADVTARRTAQEAAADRALVLESVFATSVFGVAVLDADNTVITTNRTLTDLLDYDTDDVVGMPFISFVRPEDRRALLDEDLTAPSGSAAHRVSERALTTRTGDTVWVALDIRWLDRPVGAAHRIAIVRDITQQRASVARLSRSARYDALTGLANRRTVREVADRELERASRTGSTMAVIWLDLDRFKEINDQYGHEVGDQVLRESATRLGAVVRRQDVVGRLGGDEFAVVVSGISDPSDLDPYLDRILEALARPIGVAGADLLVGGSLGVAVYPEDGATCDQLMRSADHAMYAAKASGGSGYAYHSEWMTREAEQRRALRSDIMTGITQHEFEVWFQPVVDMTDGSIAYLESLLRWRRTADEVVTARAFIGFAEDTGQIRALGRLMVDEVGAHIGQLAQAGRADIPVAVNLAVMQLLDPDEVDQVRGTLLREGNPPVLVEVTESVFLPDHAKAQDALRSLEASGAIVVIDDFGSGFSNLRLLRSLSPHFLKLDRSFLAVDPESTEGWALIRSAVDMAHAIGSRVVAEGVEEEWQARRVRELGVEMGQGYLFGDAMPLPELLEWLEERGSGSVPEVPQVLD